MIVDLNEKPAPSAEEKRRNRFNGAGFSMEIGDVA